MKSFICAMALMLFTQPLFAEDAFPAPSTGATANQKKAQVNPDAPPLPYVASLDTFGSSRITEASLRKLLGPDLDKWLKMGVSGDPDAEKLQKKLTKKIVKKYNLPFAEWSIMQYIEPGNLAIRVTLDVVEKFDVSKRMPFYKAPQLKLKDPGGLVEKWYEYQDIALKIADSGEMENKEISCGGAYHCLFGHDHPKLKPFGKLFHQGVKKHEAALIQVLKSDKDGDKRAAAAFLLAYIKDADKLVRLMIDRIKDPDALVRNNAMRVLGDIAEFHPTVKIPVQPFVPALDFPLVTDRSKAVFMIFALLERSEPAKKAALKEFQKILALLKSQQPNQSGVAYAILRQLSGKHFAPTEFEKWETWYARLPASQK